MAGGKETPRQKMIGMMYLVLLALLAMNVSKSILESFVIINEAMEKTNSNFEHKNEITYNQFDRAKMNDPKKVMEYWQKAQEVRKWAEDLDTHIDELKKHLIIQTQAVTPEIYEKDSLFLLKNVESKDNYDKPTAIMIGSEPAKPKEGEFTAHELKTMLIDMRENLIKLFPEGEETEEIRGSIEQLLATDKVPQPGAPPESWENGNFYHLPLAAVITNLSRIQSNVRNAEADAISELMGEISAEDFKFDTLAAKVIPNKNYVMLGDTYRAEVLVAAFSSTQNPVLEASTEIDTSGKIVGEVDTSAIDYNRGMATYTYVPKEEGPVEWGGVIKIKKPNGEYQPYQFKSHFIAAKPAVVVSPVKMNVFYRGLENPIEVSVPGFSADQLKVSVSNASMSGSKGKFTVKPARGSECLVTVKAEVDGQLRGFGDPVKFRVKNVPNPTPYFADVTGSGVVKRSKMLAAPGVLAKMENFDFDLKFKVTSFVLSATVNGRISEVPAKGPRITGQMKTLLKSLQPGSKFYIEKIKAVGPDGVPRDLGTISLTVIP